MHQNLPDGDVVDAGMPVSMRDECNTVAPLSALHPYPM